MARNAASDFFVAPSAASLTAFRGDSHETIRCNGSWLPARWCSRCSADRTPVHAALSTWFTTWAAASRDAGATGSTFTAGTTIRRTGVRNEHQRRRGARQVSNATVLRRLHRSDRGYRSVSRSSDRRVIPGTLIPLTFGGKATSRQIPSAWIGAQRPGEPTDGACDDRIVVSVSSFRMVP